MDARANADASGDAGRIAIGVWTEWRRGVRWRNEGMTRFLGFIVEGFARRRQFCFHLVVPRYLLAEAREDFASLKARLDIDYFIHAPEADPDDFDAVKQNLLRFANGLEEVAGWISIFPYYDSVIGLKAPVTVVFPDANPVVFPTFDESLWGPDGTDTKWRASVQLAIDCASRIVTFSEHVANGQARRLFHAAPEKFRVIPMAPPDLAPLLPFVSDRRRTPESAQRAAAILRKHAAQRGWTYLRNFPFEERKFVVVSTQDRTSKNLVCAAEAIGRLIREKKQDIKLITTAGIDFKAQWTLFPRLIEEENLSVDIISMHDLPRDAHAALYHCAEAAIHPSLFEGGLGVFPFYEAVSLGAPCAMARGPHMDEFLRHQPNLADEVFDPNDPQELARLIIRIMSDRQSILDRQRAVYEALNRRDWADVAEEYGQTVLGASPSLQALEAAVP